MGSKNNSNITPQNLYSKVESVDECKEKCKHFDRKKGVYTVECYSCKRFNADLFEEGIR